MVQYIDEPFEDCYDRGYNGPGWYFWDETQVYCYGPYPDEAAAHAAAKEYAKTL